MSADADQARCAGTSADPPAQGKAVWIVECADGACCSLLGWPGSDWEDYASCVFYAAADAQAAVRDLDEGVVIEVLHAWRCDPRHLIPESKRQAGDDPGPQPRVRARCGPHKAVLYACAVDELITVVLAARRLRNALRTRTIKGERMYVLSSLVVNALIEALDAVGVEALDALEGSRR